MIYSLITQLTKCLFSRDNSVFVVLNGVNYVIVCHTTLHYVILLLHLTSTPTVYHILKPFEIV